MTPDEFHQALRANIRKVRHSKGMLASDLSEAIGRKYDYIWRVEHGFNKPTRATVAKIAEALGVSLEELMP